MRNVLSIQSHVVFGHAGNSAAVFPMRRLGVNVWPLNTVQFSNHTQYGHWSGSAIDAGQMVELVEGIGAIGVLPRCDAVLSGYLGTPEQAQAVIDVVRAVKAANPQARYFCDPVMGTLNPAPGASGSTAGSPAGDPATSAAANAAGGGCHVEPGIQEFLVTQMPEVADAMMPNHSELQRLVGRELETAEEAVDACRELIARGPKLVLVKHLLDRNSPAHTFNMLVVSEREAWLAQRPLYPFARQPVGVGDITSAIFVARLMLGDTLRRAFEHTLAAVNAVVKTTYDAGRYELEIVAAQDQIARPREWFDAWTVDLV